MKKILSVVLTTIGTIVGAAATTGCAFGLFDEPEMPKSLID